MGEGGPQPVLSPPGAARVRGWEYVADLMKRRTQGRKMKAIELSGLEGLESLKVVDVEKPHPGANQVLLEVEAAGVNFAEIELTPGQIPRTQFPSEKIQQLIYRNQSPVGFNFPTLRPEQIAECVPSLLSLIAEGRVKLFADNTFPLIEVKKAFEALSSRRTIGKVALIP